MTDAQLTDLVNDTDALRIKSKRTKSIPPCGLRSASFLNAHETFKMLPPFPVTDAMRATIVQTTYDFITAGEAWKYENCLDKIVPTLPGLFKAEYTDEEMAPVRKHHMPVKEAELNSVLMGLAVEMTKAREPNFTAWLTAHYFLKFVRGEVDPSGLEEARPYLACMIGVIADTALDGLYECEWPGCAKVFRSEKRHEKHEARHTGTAPVPLDNTAAGRLAAGHITTPIARPAAAAELAAELPKARL